ncbi:MAG: ATP-dependent Clp protease proteolytic subunit [Rhodospirillaceae bacterium]|nr:ATP-dependent Clp protease proteolytic subunit [Rhodospirillaceae bacterium]MCA8934457.1 ATP-dependent Clp protease proteolytic subunit [Rhodospirillaceae bacterium]
MNDPRTPIRLDDEDDDDRPEEEPKEGEKAKDKPSPPIMERLLKARTVLLFGAINDKVAREISAQLLALSVDNDEPIKLIINSPGGHVESGDTIHDMIGFIKPQVKVIGTGWVASAGAHIFLGAKKENRYCLPNTRFLLHQPMGGVRGPATDIDIEANEIIKMRERLNATIARETGQPIEDVRKHTDRNFWMSAEEAKKYGVVTHIVSTAAEVD